ncbi:MAG: Spc97/Spc98 family protein [Akkermansiaceae bacterium]|nr:Spc97/Spc98 family protein [Akkermansiaceae bacterium]
MKFNHIVTLGLAAFVGFSLPADAQDKKIDVKAYYVKKAKEEGKNKSGKLSAVSIVSSTKPGTFVVKLNEDETKEVKIKDDYSTFYVITPKELVEALRLYAAEDFAPAGKALHKVRKQLENWRGLPEGPYMRAYRAEVECAVRQLDFAGALAVVNEFPKDIEKLLTPQDKVMQSAVKLLAGATREGGVDPTKIEDGIKTVMDKLGSAVTPAHYGWMYFALGAAYQSTIPADQISSHNIAAEHKVNASKAIDAFCVAGISTHGAQMQLPIEAMKRAQLLLWSMPGVQAEVKAYGHPTPAKFKKQSQDFQDAVTLAYMLINVYGVEAPADSPLAKAAELYVNTKAKK